MAMNTAEETIFEKSMDNVKKNKLRRSILKKTEKETIVLDRKAVKFNL